MRRYLRMLKNGFWMILDDFLQEFFQRTEYDASSRIEATTPYFATGPSFSKISRCGIHTGRVLVGNMGFHSRMKYGIVGVLVHLERSEARHWAISGYQL